MDERRTLVVAVRLFIVLGHGRSGSNLLRFALADHPHIHMAGELFNDSESHRRKLCRAVNREYFRDGTSGAGFLERCFFGALYPERCQAAGFKLFYNQARESPADDVWPLLRRHTELRVVRLLRRNLFAAWVSHEVAFMTDDWTLMVEENRQATQVRPFAIDPWRCQGFFEETERYIRWADDFFAEHESIRVEYEADLCGDFAATMGRVQEFLGLARHEVTPSVKKQSSRPLREQVTNYDSLRRYFRSTRYARYFEADTDERYTS